MTELHCVALLVASIAKSLAPLRELILLQAAMPAGVRLIPKNIVFL